MKLAVLGGALTPYNYNILDQELNKLIEEKQCYLFTMLCGSTTENAAPADTLGRVWAERNGAPIQWIFGPVPAILKEADYIIFLFDGNQEIKKIMMRYKMMGKHGTVIQL